MAFFKSKKQKPYQVIPRLSFYAPYVYNEYIDPDEDYTSEADRVTYRELQARCLEWCLAKNIIVEDRRPGRTKYILSPKVARAELSTVITTRNFRTLVCKEHRNALMQLIRDDGLGHINTELEQFAVTLSIMFGASVIDRLIWRLYSAYNAQPVVGADMTWTEFHGKYPSMWVLIFIQNVALFYTSES